METVQIGQTIGKKYHSPKQPTNKTNKPPPFSETE